MRRLLALAPRRPHVLRPLRPKSTAPNALSALAEDELLLPAPTIALRSGNDDAVSSTALVAAEREREALERHALYERQLELEEETLEAACADYEAMIEDLLSLGKGAELKPVQRLMAQWYEPLVARITAERKATLDGDKGGDLRIYGPLLLLLPPEQLAVLTMHTTIGLCLKHGPLGAKYSNLVTTLGETVQAEARVLKLRNLRRERLRAAEDAEGKRAVPKTFLDARALARLPTHVVNSRAKRALEEGDDTDWPTITRAKLGSALVMALLDVAKDDAGSPLLEHTIVYSNARKIGIIRAKDELLSHARCPETIRRAAMPRFLPMLVEPRRWRAYDEGGFLRLRAVAMRTHGCALQMEAFRNARGIEGGVLAGLDAMGKVPWAVNGPVFDLVKAAWASGGKWPDLPSQEDLALPEPMDLAEAVARADGDEDGGKKLYDAHLRRSARLKRRNAELHSLRCDTLLKLGIAEQFKDEAAFYFPYNVDFRGRAYPVPPNLNHLGSDVCRAMLTFAEKKRLGDDGLFWLRVHLANLFGLSKKSLDDRAAFAVAHEADIRDAYERPMDGNMWWLEADEPWQALAACRELARAAELDDPRDYECALPVHADGSCNGLQHYAALGRDHEGGRQVNLLPGEAPRDVYEGVRALVAEKVARAATGVGVDLLPTEAFGVALGDDAFDDDDEGADRHFVGVDDDSAPLGPPSASSAAAKRAREKGTWTDEDEALETVRLAQIVDGLITRKVVKQTVMTSVYGVTFVGARQQILGRLTDAVEDLLAQDPSPERDAAVARLTTLGCITPEGDVDEAELYLCACYVARLTLEVLEELFTSARHIMGWLAQCARLVSLHGQPVSWITPLGLPVVQPYRRDGQHAVKTLAQTVLLVDNSDKLPVSVTRQKSAFPPNFVHSLDSSHMLMTAVEMDHRGLAFTAVHDSYWTHAADVATMNSTLRHCFLELYEAPLLEKLLESFELRYPDTDFPPLPPRGDLDIAKVLDADYFFS